MVAAAIAVAGCTFDDSSEPPLEYDFTVAGANPRDLATADLTAPLPWQTQATGLTAVTLNGVAGAGDEVYAVGDQGTILRTADRGAHWNKLQSGTNAVLFGVWTDGSVVFAVGYAGLVLRSVDHGQSWQSTTLGNDIIGVVTGLTTSGDGGWNGEIWAAGENAFVAHSTDGGLTWITQRLGGNPFIAGIWASPSETFVVSETYDIERTRDHGATWTEVSSARGTGIWSNGGGDFVVSDDDGIEVSHDGALAFSDVGGAQSIKTVGLAAFADGNAFAPAVERVVRHVANDFGSEVADEPIDGVPRAIWGSDEHNLFVVGDGGFIAHRP
jgi:photosystem II stability/assembly factor-like uncharacterized protein